MQSFRKLSFRGSLARPVNLWVVVGCAIGAFAVAPSAAQAIPLQMFHWSGSGDVRVHAVESTGGQVVLTSVTSGVVEWRDASALKDMTYSVSSGQQPQNGGGWLKLTVGNSPVDITISGSNFEANADATFAASVRSHGVVRTRGRGSEGYYGVGDKGDGSGEPRFKRKYTTKRPKVGKIVSEGVTAVGRGVVRGDFATTADKPIVLRGRSGGGVDGVRFEDLGAAQDMAVTCAGGPGGKRVRTNGTGHEVVTCSGTGRGRTMVSGSDAIWKTRAGRVSVSIPAGAAAHLTGDYGSYEHAFFAPAS